MHTLLITAFAQAHVPLVHSEVELLVSAWRRCLVVLGISFLRHTQPLDGILQRQRGEIRYNLDRHGHLTE